MMVQSKKVVTSRTGEIRIVDKDLDRVMISNHIPYGSTLSVKAGKAIKKGDVIS
jgi:DNA-directed RNA polymerase subunit beta'